MPFVGFPAFSPGFLAPAALLCPGANAAHNDAAAEAGENDPEKRNVRDRQARVLRIERIERQRHRMPVRHRQWYEDNRDGKQDQVLDKAGHGSLPGVICKNAMSVERKDLSGINRPRGQHHHSTVYAFLCPF